MTKLPTTFATLVLTVTLTAGAVLAQSPGSERMRLLRGEAPPDRLASALESDDLLVARTAARLLPAKGSDALRALGRALRHDDMLVRRSAAMNLDALGTDGLELLQRALRDDSEYVRQGAVYALMGMKHTAEVSALIDRATDDESALVQRAAVAAARTAYVTADTIPLPTEDWRFKNDVEDVGLDQQWFGADYDDSNWEAIAIEEFWGERGPDRGVGWYRRTFTLPERDRPARAQLAFEAVDESAWVWINGEFAGEHDLGPDGWDDPFRIDVTGMLNWGGENRITVRVLNTAMAGGIYKPVSVVLLEPAQ
ncbi:MAG: sugar-binding domain-containing protein [Armatimonadota bacterium]